MSTCHILRGTLFHHKVKGIGGGGDPKKESVFFHFHSEDNVWHIWTLFICSRPLHFGVSSISMSNFNVFFLKLKYNPQFTLVKVTKQVMIVTSKGINTKNQLLDLKIHKLQAVLCFKKTKKKNMNSITFQPFNLFFTRALSPLLSPLSSTCILGIATSLRDDVPKSILG